LHNLDLSENKSLNNLRIGSGLDGLISLNIKNGNNENLDFELLTHLNLDCIQVDSGGWIANMIDPIGVNPGDTYSDRFTFSEDCGY